VTRVLVAGRNRLFAEALAAHISTVRGWSAEAYFAEGSVRTAAGTHEPDVLLVATEPDEGRHTWVTTLRTRWPSAALLLLCARSATDADDLAASLGAAGWTDPGADLQTLLRSIRELSHDGVTPRAEANGGVERRSTGSGLTSRQVEIVRLLAAGQRAPSIATDLAISEHTVRTHVQNVMARLGAHSRIELVARARRLGLLSSAVDTSGGP
jgi:DNA-binding NarL/FixJ family response regulator